MVLVNAGRAEALARAELLSRLVALGLALAVLGPRASFARFLLANAFLFFGCFLAAGTAGLAALARSLTSASSDAADGIAWSPIFPVAKAVVEGHFWNALARWTSLSLNKRHRVIAAITLPESRSFGFLHFALARRPVRPRFWLIVALAAAGFAFRSLVTAAFLVISWDSFRALTRSLPGLLASFAARGIAGAEIGPLTGTADEPIFKAILSRITRTFIARNFFLRFTFTTRLRKSDGFFISTETFSRSSLDTFVACGAAAAET